MRNYTERRKKEIAVRDAQWFDMQQLPKIVKNPDAVPPKRYPVRIDEKTVVWVRESNLHKYFPLRYRKATMEEYKAEYDADPKNFLC